MKVGDLIVEKQNIAEVVGIGEDGSIVVMYTNPQTNQSIEFYYEVENYEDIYLVEAVSELKER